MKPEKIVADFVDVLGTTLVGIYLHGSLAMNSYNFKSSDIDFLVVDNVIIHGDGGSAVAETGDSLQNFYRLVRSEASVSFDIFKP